MTSATQALSPNAPATRRPPRFHRLTVSDVRHETPDAVSLAFAVPADLADAYTFTPGQHLTLRRCDDTNGIRRCYSISSAPDDGELRVVVKRLEGGEFSSFVHADLTAGMELDVMTPEGHFGAHKQQGGSRTYLALVAGSGITPVISIIRNVLASEPQSNFILFYGNRTLASIIFRDELNDLKDIYPERFSLFHTLTREGTDVPLYSGRLDVEKLRKFSRALFTPSEIDDAFLCGPAEMIAGLHEELEALGVPGERIHEELFTPAGGGTAVVAPRPLSVATANGEGVEVTAILDGTARSFVMTSEHASIVDAAAASGIELPFSCKGGMCSTCRAKIVEGDAEMALNYSLEPWELKENFTLTCQARPSTEKLTVDFDHV